jgi:hypothetical protein
MRDIICAHSRSVAAEMCFSSPAPPAQIRPVVPAGVVAAIAIDEAVQVWRCRGISMGNDVDVTPDSVPVGRHIAMVTVTDGC